MKERILHHYHNIVNGGHSGDDLTYRRIKEKFYWKGLQREVRKWVLECHICQKNKPLLQMPTGLLQPLSVPDRAWKSIFVNMSIELRFECILDYLETLREGELCEIKLFGNYMQM